MQAIFKLKRLQAGKSQLLSKTISFILALPWSYTSGVTAWAKCNRLA